MCLHILSWYDKCFTLEPWTSMPQICDFIIGAEWGCPGWSSAYRRKLSPKGLTAWYTYVGTKWCSEVLGTWRELRLHSPFQNKILLQGTFFSQVEFANYVFVWGKCKRWPFQKKQICSHVSIPTENLTRPCSCPPTGGGQKCTPTVTHNEGSAGDMCVRS